MGEFESFAVAAVAALIITLNQFSGLSPVGDLIGVLVSGIKRDANPKGFWIIQSVTGLVCLGALANGIAIVFGFPEP